MEKGLFGRLASRTYEESSASSAKNNSVNNSKFDFKSDKTVTNSTFGQTLVWHFSLHGKPTFAKSTFAHKRMKFVPRQN